MIYKFGAYVRLSEADKKEGIVYDNSESIENQLLIIEDYIAGYDDMVLVDKYIDDGYTGLNYKRDEYQRMMEDIDAGKINGIITKSLSRLGREQAETLMLFKKEFVIKGIRYIAVQDNIDFKGRITDYNIPFRTLLNDMYSFQTSNDIRSSMRAKAKNGEFIGAFASYGYLKAPDNKNRLIIDETAASVVRRIFSSYIEGINILGIAKILNREGILCPSQYKNKIQGLNYHNAKPLVKTDYWTYSGVKSILKKRIYTGDLVQHTKEKLAYNIEKYVCVPEEEWVIIENNHPPIVSKEEFKIVQNRFKERTRTMDFKSVHKYAGYLFCGDCGRSMSKRDTKTGMLFRCGTYVRAGKAYCSSHLIGMAEVDQAVLSELRRYVAAGMKEADFLEMDQFTRQTEHLTKQNRLDKLQLEKKDLVRRKKQMLGKLSKDIISDEDYLIFKEEYESNLELTERKIKDCQVLEKSERASAEKERVWIDNFINVKNIQSIDRDVIVNLIERIYLFENGNFEMVFKFKNPFL